MVPGTLVDHAEFGRGRVRAALGRIVTVEFLGELIDVDASQLTICDRSVDTAPVVGPSRALSDVAFRQAFEAINVGVVPANPEHLIRLTIGGDILRTELRTWLNCAPTAGACRVFFGYYGSGKSHHLRLVNSVALTEGWVTASIELDPKSADPAKPSTVYQQLLSSLRFPPRSDGSRCEDFFDLVKEIRDNWGRVRTGRYLRASPWYGPALQALLHETHSRDDSIYLAAVNWLAGQVKQITPIRALSRLSGHGAIVPGMPLTRDNGLIYAYHLVVINEILRTLGYRGLAVVVDEAEHVRTYSANRYSRASNFLDVLARCSHPARDDLAEPLCDYDLSGVPPFWREGPHFALIVGLTYGEDAAELRGDAGTIGAMIHSKEDIAHIDPPTADAYESWALDFLSESATRLGPRVGLLGDQELRKALAGCLRQGYATTSRDESPLRLWTKLAALPSAILMSQVEVSAEVLLDFTQRAIDEVAGNVYPWDDE